MKTVPQMHDWRPEPKPLSSPAPRRLCRNIRNLIIVMLINMKAMYFAASVDRLTGEGGIAVWNTSQWTYIRSIPGRE